MEGFWRIVKAEMYSLNKFNCGGELHSAIDERSLSAAAQRVFLRSWFIRSLVNQRAGALAPSCRQDACRSSKNTKGSARHRANPLI